MSANGTFIQSNVAWLVGTHRQVPTLTASHSIIQFILILPVIQSVNAIGKPIIRPVNANDKLKGDT